MGYQIFNAIYVLVCNFSADQNGSLGEQVALTLVEICVFRNIQRDGGSFPSQARELMQRARRRWACYHHIAHSTSLKAQVLSVAGERHTCM